MRQSSVGSKIKQVRELRNFTQDYMAQRLEISQAMYSKIERGESDIGLGQLNKIAKELDIDLTHLLTFDSSLMIKKITNKQLAEHTTGMVVNHGLPDDERKLFERMLADKDQEIAFLRGLLGGRTNL